MKNNTGPLFAELESLQFYEGFLYDIGSFKHEIPNISVLHRKLLFIDDSAELFKGSQNAKKIALRFKYKILKRILTNQALFIFITKNRPSNAFHDPNDYICPSFCLDSIIREAFYEQPQLVSKLVAMLNIMYKITFLRSSTSSSYLLSSTSYGFQYSGYQQNQDDNIPSCWAGCTIL